MRDYKLIDESISYYQNEGFNRIEAPWTVSKYVDSITKPEEVPSFELKHNNKCLVASGEQSFLYLALKNHLPPGKYQTVTPCFRNDDFDFLHTKYFIKNELIVTDHINNSALMEVIDIALAFYRTYIPSADVTQVGEGFDIEVYGKELGSYGIRECEHLKWIYATGCAEPRTSNLIKLHGVSY